MSAKKALTLRQKEVLDLYITGVTYRDIAQTLGVSPHTVRRHIEQIYKRTELPRNNKYSLRMAFESVTR